MAPSMVIVPSCGPALKVILFSPRASAGSGRCECWMSLVSFSASSPVPLPFITNRTT